MMIATFFRAVFLMLALGVSQGAMALTVFDNGAPDNVSGTQMSEFLVADSFTLSSAANLTNIHFWSAQSAASVSLGSVYWSIFGNAINNQPGDTIFSGLVTVAGVATPATTSFGYGIYVFDVPVMANLAAGFYWLGLHNGPLGSIAPSEMLWANSGTGGGGSLYLDGGEWVGSENEQAFRLDATAITSPIPEPYMPAMMLAGLATLAGLRRFKRLDKSSPSSP
jgi:hypothetical protein